MNDNSGFNSFDELRLLDTDDSNVKLCYNPKRGQVMGVFRYGQHLYPKDFDEYIYKLIDKKIHEMGIPLHERTEVVDEG